MRTYVRTNDHGRDSDGGGAQTLWPHCNLVQKSPHSMDPTPHHKSII